MSPRDGGTAIDLSGMDAYAVVAESVHECRLRIKDALTIDAQADTNAGGDHLWVEFTVLADPDEERPRRPAFFRADQIVGLTYLSPEHVEKIEEEIS